MLKGLFGRSNRPIEPETPPLPPAPLMRKPSPTELRQLIEFFPIGKKIRYSPEYKKEIVLDTVVVAYCIEGEFVYSLDAVEYDDQDIPAGFLLGPQRQRIDAQRVNEFQLMVPDTSDQELTLDYNSRALIGRNRQFHRGNTIALISNAAALGVANLETEVDKKFILRDGPYAQSAVVLLTPLLPSFSVSDQRNTHRAHVRVPIVMTIQDRLRGPCVIVDFSDTAMRIRVREGQTMPPMNRGDAVTLDVELAEQRLFRLRAAVLRRSAEACVVKLTGQIRNDRVIPLTPLDLMELKAGLLNYGK